MPPTRPGPRLLALQRSFWYQSVPRCVVSCTWRTGSTVAKTGSKILDRVLDCEYPKEKYVVVISQSFLRFSRISEENSFQKRHESDGLRCWRRARTRVPLWRCVCWRLGTSRLRGRRPPTCVEASIITTRDAVSAAQERSVGVGWLRGRLRLRGRRQLAAHM